VFAFFVQMLLAKLGLLDIHLHHASIASRAGDFLSGQIATSLFLLQLSWCAIKLLHVVWIRVLILGSVLGGLDKYILDLFSLTLLQDASSSSSRLEDYVGTHHLAMSVLIFL